MLRGLVCALAFVILSCATPHRSAQESEPIYDFGVTRLDYLGYEVLCTVDENKVLRHCFHARSIPKRTGPPPKPAANPEPSTSE